VTAAPLPGNDAAKVYLQCADSTKFSLPAQQRLNFLPLPQEHGSLRPTFAALRAGS
jgi:hypothetical protein